MLSCRYAEYCYGECRYAECHDAIKNIFLSFSLSITFMLLVILLNVMAPCKDVIQGATFLHSNKQNAIMLSVIILSIIVPVLEPI